MTITLPISCELELRLREESSVLDTEAKEAVALDLFRKEKISHFELGQILGLDRFETDSFLVKHREYAQSLTLEDLETDARVLSEMMAARRP